VASAGSTLAILLVMAAIIWIAGQIFGAVIGVGDLAAAVVGTWAFALSFAGLALCVSGAIGNWTTVTGIAAGVLVTMYVIDIAARIADALHDVGPVSAFHWYGSPLIDGLDGSHAALAAGGVALAVVGAVLFERRDVHA
jgi:hypothetical protein